MELSSVNGLSAAPLSGEALASSLARTRVEDAELAVREGRSAEAAEAFEKLFATLFAKEMRKALPEGFFGDGPGADVYNGWLDEHLGAALAERDAFGFAAMIKEDLLRIDARRAEEQENDAALAAEAPE